MSKQKKPKPTWSERKPILFRKKRSGVALTRGEIKEINHSLEIFYTSLKAYGVMSIASEIEFTTALFCDFKRS